MFQKFMQLNLLDTSLSLNFEIAVQYAYKLVSSPDRRMTIAKKINLLKQSIFKVIPFEATVKSL